MNLNSLKNSRVIFISFCNNIRSMAYFRISIFYIVLFNCFSYPNITLPF